MLARTDWHLVQKEADMPAPSEQAQRGLDLGLLGMRRLDDEHDVAGKRRKARGIRAGKTRCGIHDDDVLGIAARDFPEHEAGTPSMQQLRHVRTVRARNHSTTTSAALASATPASDTSSFVGMSSSESVAMSATPALRDTSAAATVVARSSNDRIDSELGEGFTREVSTAGRAT